MTAVNAMEGCPAPVSRSTWWWLWGLLGAVLAVSETLRFLALPAEIRDLWNWLEPLSIDSTLWLVWWGLFPWAWSVRSRPVTTATPIPAAPDFRDWLAAICLAGLAWSMSAAVGREFGKSPPAYHDEYSYLVQAETLRAGRISYPSPSRLPHLFDQVHVLNEGQFASRYYPGTGLWIVPWLGTGTPQQAQWFAQAIIAWLAFWTARHWGGRLTGVLSGLLVALSPGLVLFSNLLLAHHPCLVGGALAYYGAAIRSRSLRIGPLLLMTLGICWATICRPATGVALGLPLVWGLLRDLWYTVPAERLRATGLLLSGGALPVLVTIAGMLWYHAQLTGHWQTSPYQLYTDRYTPGHVYGFYNVTRGAAAQGDRVLPIVTRDYDAWAEELTPSGAVRKTGVRLFASGRWTLALVPLVLCSLSWWLRSDSRHRPGNLLWGGILALHVLHSPYWFTGIMDWHYVFESAWLWCLVVGLETAVLFREWSQIGQRGLRWWWSAGLLLAIGLNWISAPPFWDARLQQGIREVRFARRKYAAVEQLFEAQVTQRPALVLIEPDPAERHLDYVTNSPDFQQDIWRARYVPAEADLNEIMRTFPERTIYLFRVKTGEFRVLRLATTTSP